MVWRLDMISSNDMRKRIERAGSKIFSVRFIKRTTGEERLMVCRRYVSHYCNFVNPIKKRQREDNDFDVITVWDVVSFQRLKHQYLSRGVNYKRAVQLAGEHSYKRISLDGVIETSLKP